MASMFAALRSFVTKTTDTFPYELGAVHTSADPARTIWTPHHATVKVSTHVHVTDCEIDMLSVWSCYSEICDVDAVFYGPLDAVF